MGKKPKRFRLAALLACLCGAGMAGAQEPLFRRGDANQDRVVEIPDAIESLMVLFLGEPSPGCDDALDANDDGYLNITDPIHILRHFLHGGPPPPAPFEACGADPTADAVGCAAFIACDPASAAPCLDQRQIDEILPPVPAFTICLPAGALNLPADPFTVSVCPAANAAPCGAAGLPGCAMELTSITGALNIAERKVAIRVEGRVDDLPIEVAESVLNTRAVCLTDFHGAQADMPFSFDIAIPLILEEAEPEVLVVIGTGEPAIENTDLRLTTSGNLLCRLFQAGQGAFVDVLAGALQSGLAGMAQTLQQGVVGLRLCPPPGP